MSFAVSIGLAVVLSVLTTLAFQLAPFQAFVVGLGWGVIVGLFRIATA